MRRIQSSLVDFLPTANCYGWLAGSSDGDTDVVT